MRKKIYFLAIVLFIFALTIVGCKKQSPSEPEITSLANTATVTETMDLSTNTPTITLSTTATPLITATVTVTTTVTPTNTCVVSYWYLDADVDGYGESGGTSTQACSAPSGYVDNDYDCDDGDKDVNPDAVEYCNAVDDDCDGDVDEAGAVDEATWYIDSDVDGYGSYGTTVQACSQPIGFVDNGIDCDDSNLNVFPGNVEICDGSYTDSDCDGSADCDDSDCDMSPLCTP